MSHSYDRNWYIQEKWDIFSLFFKPLILFGNAGARAGIETSAETPSQTVLSVTAAILIYRKDGGKVKS